MELHGFLSYLIKCNVEGREYKVFGYKGKQVRDNIHSEDVARFMYEFWKAPACGRGLQPGRRQGQLLLHPGGLPHGRSGHRPKHELALRGENRIGDHICYYSDLRKMKAHYPAWGITTVPARDLRRDRGKLDRRGSA